VAAISDMLRSEAIRHAEFTVLSLAEAALAHWLLEQRKLRGRVPLRANPTADVLTSA
jgi:hypothetical protein